MKQKYNASEMAIIQSKQMRPVIVPNGPERPYISPTPAPIAVKSDVKVPPLFETIVLSFVNRLSGRFGPLLTFPTIKL